MTKSWPMWLGLALGLGAVASGFTMGGDLQEQWRLATRYTARVGFPLLILAYVARPLQQLRPGPMPKFLLSRRKWIGLGFAFSHTIHLIAIVMLYRLLDEAPSPVTLVGGGFGYILLWAMALTSNTAAMKRLGHRWKRLHRFGIHYLWLIFVQSYLGRIFDPETLTVGPLGSGIALLAAALRFAAWRKSKVRLNIRE